MLSIGRHFETLSRKGFRLRVSHALHSARMDPMLESFVQLVRELRLRPPAVPIVSNVTGELARPEELMSPDYWAQQVRETVRFHQGIQTLERQGVDAFLELRDAEHARAFRRDPAQCFAHRTTAYAKFGSNRLFHDALPWRIGAGGYAGCKLTRDLLGQRFGLSCSFSDGVSGELDIVRLSFPETTRALSVR